MKNRKSILLSAAASGLLFGTAAASLTSCSSTGDQPVMERHACKGQNACKGQGGCKTDKHACKGQNACKGQGGCRAK
jgi:hypothetical protein